MPRLIEIVCTLTSIKFHAKDSGWCKLLVRHDSEFKMAVGTANVDDLNEKHDYVLHGYWEDHETYGRQFRFTSICESAPVSFTGVITYLQQATGLGLARAKLIWNKYQDSSLKMVREQPHAIAATCNIPMDMATEWAMFFTERVKDERFNQELMGLLSGHGFQFERVRQALLKKWGYSAVDRIKKDPYLLLKFPSAGWARTDAVYTKLGKDPHALKRQILCLHHAMMTDKSGHTWMEQWDAESAIMRGIGGTALRIPDALRIGTIARFIDRWRPPGPKHYVADHDRAEWERRLGAATRRLLEGQPKWFEWMGKNRLEELYDVQRPQILHALENHRLFQLTGPPGTGKSFALSRIVKAISDRVGLSNIAVVALAGKAAVRCTQLMAEARLPLRANTIHSTMGFDFHDGEYNFYHSHERRLEGKVFIIDEWSMVDTNLAGKFFDALPDDAHVILVGDEHQLEPVGHGAPMRDFLAADVPTAKLTEIQRFAGTIVRACHSMVNGGPILIDDQIRLDLEPPQNMKLVYADAHTMAHQLRDLVAKIRDLGVHDPVWDVQVMVAVNANSPVGRQPMNVLLQNLLNPDGYQVEGNPFRVDDKVINLKNGLFKDNDDQERKRYVANGEFGEVIEVYPRKSVVQFNGHHVIIPHGKLVKDDEDDEDLERASIDLGYAVTVHKMQGSQTPIAIVVLDEYGGASGPHGICGKAWLYTAISRAQQLCFLLGKQTTALSMMRKSGLQNRRTRLAEYIRASEGSINATHTSTQG